MVVGQRSSALLALLLVSLLAFPAASAADATTAFGTVVQAGDADESTLLNAGWNVFDRTLAGFVDDNGDATFDAGEALYLTGSTGSVDINDVRLVSAAGNARGTQVRASDSDFGNPLSFFGSDVDFIDDNGDAVLSAGEPVLFDLDGSQTVSVADLVLAGPGSGALITGSSSRIGTPMTLLPGQWSFIDEDGNAIYGRGDTVAFDLAQNLGQGFLTPLDFIASGAQTGHIVAADDALAMHLLQQSLDGFGLTGFAFRDNDGDAVLDSSEPVYLTGGSTVSPLDVRVANAAPFARGSQVRGSDSDVGAALVSIDGYTTYVDLDGNAAFGPGEPLLYDSDLNAQESPGDIRLAGPSAGSIVTASGRELMSYGGTLMVDDLDGNGFYSPGDLVVLDDGLAYGVPFLATVQDVPLSGPLAGQPITATQAMSTYVLVQLGGYWIGFVDADADGVFDSGESAYVGSGLPATVSALDVRLASATQQRGSQVRASDSDFGLPLTQFAGGLAFVDNNGNAVFGAGDLMLVDGNGDGIVSLGDLLLTGPSAGTRVGPTTPGLNSAVVASSHLLAFFDADGSEGYSRGDTVYLDGDGTGASFATPADVRLSGALPVASGGGGGGGATGTATSTSSTTEQGPYSCDATTATPTPTLPPGLPANSPGGPFPQWVLTSGASDVVTIPEGQARTVPFTLAARGAPLTNAHLMIDRADGLSVYPDPLVKTVRPGTDQVFYLHIVTGCLGDDTGSGGHTVQVHVAGRNGATQMETIQVVVFSPAQGGESIPALGALAVAGAALAVAFVLRRRLV